MTPFERRRNPDINRMAEDMQIRNLAARTIDSYTWHVAKFCAHFGKKPAELGPEEIRQYQLFLVHEKKASWSFFNQAVCALRFLYEVTLGKPWVIQHIPFGKRPKKLPVVLSDQEAARLLECTHNLKHRMVLLCCYAAGLRLAEATHVKVADIDGQRAQIRVTCGKGSKERRVPASPRLLDALREYWKLHRPGNYLFPGKTADVPLSSPTIQKACRLSAALAGIKNIVTPHTLRHSYATSLLEAGVDVLTISKLLGHSSFVTTMIYLHVRRQHFDRTPSPLDWLPVRQCPQWAERRPESNTLSVEPPAITAREPQPEQICASTLTQPPRPQRRTSGRTPRAKRHRSCQVYNSCGDRHCPLCAGARRADWMEKTRELILPGINYFQVIFTLPDRLSRLILANRRALYGLLFRSAWQALRQELHKQGIEPAAVLVLHTWNQELGHHPHIHALVPGAGPSVNPDNDPCWTVARDASFPQRRDPFLVDVQQLGRGFRDRFVRGLGMLLRQGRLRLPDEWSQLHATRVRRDWLQALRQSPWNVFISGPPHGQSDPEQVLKYMTRYLTGGPISDTRIVAEHQDHVTFLARGKDKSQAQPQVAHTIPGVEFLRRWSLHILPKGFTRCRRYGGYHGSRCAEYLETCRRLLGPQPAVEQLPAGSPPESGVDHNPRCPRCEQPLVLLERTARPSWRDVFQGSAQQPRRVNFPWLRRGPPTGREPVEPDG